MEPTQLSPTPGEASLTSGKYRSREGTFFAGHEVACQTLLLTAYLDPILQEFLTDTQIRTFLQDRKILTVPITSFLLATDPEVRPSHIHQLEESVTKINSPITESHIKELKDIEKTNIKKRHTDLEIIKAHPKINDISDFTTLLNSEEIAKNIKRIIVSLHGNLCSDDTISTSCFGYVSHINEPRLFLMQHIETLAESIAIFFSKQKSKKTIHVEVIFLTCADYQDKKLYTSFKKQLHKQSRQLSISIEPVIKYLASWHKVELLSYTYASSNIACNIPAIRLLEFSSPNPIINNIELISDKFNPHLLHHGEEDYKIKKKHPSYMGSFDLVHDLILNQKKLNNLQELQKGNKETEFSIWSTLKNDPSKIHQWINENPSQVNEVLQFKDMDGRTLGALSE